MVDQEEEDTFITSHVFVPWEKDGKYCGATLVNGNGCLLPESFHSNKKGEGDEEG